MESCQASNKLQLAPLKPSKKRQTKELDQDAFNELREIRLSLNKDRTEAIALAAKVHSFGETTNQKNLTTAATCKSPSPALGQSTYEENLDCSLARKAMEKIIEKFFGTK
jgi:hypothetical protein